MSSSTNSQAQEVFEDFLMRMDDQIEALQADALRRRIDLDFRVDRLDRLEAYFDAVSQELQDRDARESFLVSCARYLGEVVRLRYGGKWVLPLDDKRNANYNTPVVVGHAPNGVEFAPISVMRAYALRRVRGTLARAVEGQTAFKGPDLDDLIEG